MTDVTQLGTTIVPKSDQLNADDLIANDLVVRIVAVKAGDAEQPVVLELANGVRPYKPCKSMRRVLITAWGDNGHQWVGKSMRLYRDPEVKFGGVAVGGIRISELSDIPKPLNVALTATRGKRLPYTVKPLEVEAVPFWDDQALEKKLPAIVDSVRAGKISLEAAYKRLEKTAALTDQQRARIADAVAVINDGDEDQF